MPQAFAAGVLGRCNWQVHAVGAARRRGEAPSLLGEQGDTRIKLFQADRIALKGPKGRRRERPPADTRTCKRFPRTRGRALEREVDDDGRKATTAERRGSRVARRLVRGIHAAPLVPSLDRTRQTVEAWMAGTSPAGTGSKARCSTPVRPQP